jgi:hypothetical protein
VLTRRAAVLCLLAGVAGLAGCATPEEQVADGLQARLDAVHDGYLERRALDPYSTGAAALEALDPYGHALETSTGPGSVSLVLPISVRRIDGGGRSYRETSLGACIRIVVRAGTGGTDRGGVTTGPVDCPVGGPALRDAGMDADVLTTALDPRSDDVGEPAHDPSECLSGEVCTEGGG